MIKQCLVMDEGEIQQYGTGEEVWNNQGNGFGKVVCIV